MEQKIKKLKSYLSDLKYDLKLISKIKKEDINNIEKCKYFFETARNIAKEFKILNSIINEILKPSNLYKSSVFKKFIINNIRDKYYVCEEVRIKNLRFDLLSIEKYKENPKVIGYEIKTSKNDLIQDIKYENYLKHCNILYFVVPQTLIEVAKEKINESNLKKHIGIYSLDKEGNLKLIKRAVSNKKVLNFYFIKETILNCGYNRYVYL